VEAERRAAVAKAEAERAERHAAVAKAEAERVARRERAEREVQRTAVATGEAAPAAKDARVVSPSTASPAGAPPGADIPDFAPHTTWDGPRPGCVFKLGASGVGYYKDTKAAAEKRAHKSADSPPGSEWVLVDGEGNSSVDAPAAATEAQAEKPSLALQNDLLYELD
jgi:hypothetical protein